MAERGDLSSQISRKSYFSRFLGQKGVETPLLEVTRREAPFELPWADWDDLRLSGYLHDVLSTVKRLDMGGACPLSEWFDLAQSQSQKSPRIGSGG